MAPVWCRLPTGLHRAVRGLQPCCPLGGAARGPGPCRSRACKTCQRGVVVPSRHARHGFRGVRVRKPVIRVLQFALFCTPSWTCDSSDVSEGHDFSHSYFWPISFGPTLDQSMFRSGNLGCVVCCVLCVVCVLRRTDQHFALLSSAAAKHVLSPLSGGSSRGTVARGRASLPVARMVHPPLREFLGISTAPRIAEDSSVQRRAHVSHKSDVGAHDRGRVLPRVDIPPGSTRKSRHCQRTTAS